MKLTHCQAKRDVAEKHAVVGGHPNFNQFPQWAAVFESTSGNWSSSLALGFCGSSHLPHTSPELPLLYFDIQRGCI